MPSNNLQIALRSGLTMGSLFTGASMVHYILKPDLVRQEAPSKQNGLACAPRLPKLTCSRCESWACSSHRPCLTWQLQLRRLNEKLKGLLRRLPSAEQSRVLSSRLTWLDWATIPILPHQSTLVKLSLHEIHTAIRTWLAHVSALGVSVRCPAPSPPRQHIDIPRPPTRHAAERVRSPNKLPQSCTPTSIAAATLASTSILSATWLRLLGSGASVSIDLRCRRPPSRQTSCALSRAAPTSSASS